MDENTSSVLCSQCQMPIMVQNEIAEAAFRGHPDLEYQCPECRQKQYYFDLGRQIGYEHGFAAGKMAALAVPLLMAF